MRAIICSFIIPLLVIGAGTALADDRRDYTVHYKQDADFEEVFADLEDAIINKGLVIDYVGFVNTMINRTAAAVTDSAGYESPYLNAKFLQFCSAKLTHEAIQISPKNIATCPYVVFVYQTREKPDRIVMGYRNPEIGIPGPTRFVMEKVDNLIKEIVADALSE